MSDITLYINKKEGESIKELMSHYGIGTKGELISKALSALKVAAYAEKTNGQLILRKGNKETQVIIK